MNLVFEFFPGKGSLRDRVNGTIPTNTNGVILQTEYGRALSCNGAASLEFGASYWIDKNSPFCVVIQYRHRGDPAGYPGILALNTAENQRYTFALSNNVAYRHLFFGCADAAWGRFRVEFNPKIMRWYHVIVTYNGRDATDPANYAVYINNTVDIVSSAAAFGSTPNFGNHIGLLNDGANYFTGEISRIAIFDAVPTSDERAALYSTDQKGFTFHKPLITNVGTADMILTEDLTNEDADGSTMLNNWSIASGSFRCLEDSTGKYIECTSDGTIQIAGVDLSGFTGNGYIAELTGDLNADEGSTVDAATALSFAGNVLSVAMTTGQKLRKLVIQGAA